MGYEQSGAGEYGRRVIVSNVLVLQLAARRSPTQKLKGAPRRFATKISVCGADVTGMVLN